MGHSTLRIFSRFLLGSINSITSRPHLIGRNQMEELRQLLSLLSAYHLLRMTLTWLYSQSAIPHPQGHTYSPALRLFGRVLRRDLPQTADALEPATPPRDTVVQEHINEPTTYGLVFLSRIFNPGHLCVCQTTPDVVVQSLDSRGNRRSCRSSILHDKVKGENSASKSCSDPTSPFHRQRLSKFYTLSTSTA